MNIKKEPIKNIIYKINKKKNVVNIFDIYSLFDNVLREKKMKMKKNKKK
jgi:hypothetical protein